MITNEELLGINDYFRTSDLALVTALSLFFPIASIDKEPSGKAFFLFRQNGEEFGEVIKKYWSRQLAIEPQQFFSQIKIIKAMIAAEQ